MPGIAQQPDRSDNSTTDNPEPERERTLTDHLNKKLFSAFLNRINSENDPINKLIKEIQEENQARDEEEFK